MVDKQKCLTTFEFLSNRYRKCIIKIMSLDLKKFFLTSLSTWAKILILLTKYSVLCWYNFAVLSWKVIVCKCVSRPLDQIYKHRPF